MLHAYRCQIGQAQPDFVTRPSQTRQISAHIEGILSVCACTRGSAMYIADTETGTCKKKWISDRENFFYQHVLVLVCMLFYRERPGLRRMAHLLQHTVYTILKFSAPIQAASSREPASAVIVLSQVSVTRCGLLLHSAVSHGTGKRGYR